MGGGAVDAVLNRFVAQHVVLTGTLLSVYWGMLTAGRFLVGAVAERLDHHAGSRVLAVLALLLLLVNRVRQTHA